MINTKTQKIILIWVWLTSLILLSSTLSVGEITIVGTVPGGQELYAQKSEITYQAKGISIPYEKLGQAYAEAYEEILKNPGDTNAIYSLKRMVAATPPLGTGCAIIYAEDPDTTKRELPAHITFASLFYLHDAAKKIAHATTGQDIKETAYKVAEASEMMTELIKQLLDGIKTGEISKHMTPDSPAILQTKNPYGWATWMAGLKYLWGRPPEELREEVITNVIPRGGCAVITKEVKGLKLQVGKGKVIWKYSAYWLEGFTPYYPHDIWYIHFIPAQFIKTITYCDTRRWWWPFGGIRKRVEKQIVTEEELIDFWSFFEPTPCCCKGTAKDTIK